MTQVFPRPDSPELAPYALPFGRMMLAYGRAYEALVELVRVEKPEEVEARTFVQGSADWKRKLAELFYERAEVHWFTRMVCAVSQFATVAGERHHVIHGEWWFDRLGPDPDTLLIRRLHKGKLEHLRHVTPDQLMEWTRILVHVADDFEDLEDAIQREREAQSSAPPATA